MSVINKREVGDTYYEEVNQLNPFPVEMMNAPYVKGEVFKTQRIPIPGIGAAAAYSIADAFGTKFAITVPPEGTIAQVVFLDYDDEGLDKELVLFSEDFTQTADNSAFAATDADLANCIGVISVDTWYDYSSNRVGMATPAFPYLAARGVLYAQFVTRGADNIAATAMPQFFLVIV